MQYEKLQANYVCYRRYGPDHELLKFKVLKPIYNSSCSYTEFVVKIVDVHICSVCLLSRNIPDISLLTLDHDILTDALHA